MKQVMSGDTIIIWANPKGNKSPEETKLILSYIIAPKLALRPNNPNEETKEDEPWAWEAREHLRKKIVGKEVYYIKQLNPANNRLYGTVWMRSNGENIVDSLISEGLVTVRRDSRNLVDGEQEAVQRLIALEDAAKAAKKGKWGSGPDPQEHVRKIQWSQENPTHLLSKYAGKPVDAVIEQVRDGSTVRAFLLPSDDKVYKYITLMITGIRCTGFKLDASGKPDPKAFVEFAEEAKYFVEKRLLQQDVQIRLDSVNNANFVGSILFPKGNIAESLLREGLAKCIDWSITFLKPEEAEKLRKMERSAKEKRVRLWRDYQSNAQTFSDKDKDFTGTVVEVYNGDAISVKTANGTVKKVFLSSIRAPREPGRTADEDGKLPPRSKNFRPLYDIPWMFEAREFLRKKLISKKVHCTLDYISPARDNFPEKSCYTVTIGGQYVAETMVSKGLATVVRHRQDDDQRSSRYDELRAAEEQALKGLKGVHAKKDIPQHRINDLTVDHSRIKPLYLPSWQRALRTEGIVEFVASGSRVRLYIPKDSCLVTFLLAGISCPRSSKPTLNGVPAQEAETCGDEALAFTKEKILQRDVSVHIEATDKAGACVIGWLWTENNTNLSVALVEEGLAEVHFSAEKSEHYRALKAAEDKAKAAKKNIWASYVEETEEKVEEEKEDKIIERKVNFESVIITDVTADLHFFAQNTDQGAKLEGLMNKLRLEFQNNPPITGAFTPRRGEICAAQFSEDKEWYRARIERVQNGNANVSYIDYGNKETVPFTRLASLPSGFSGDKPYATQYVLALVQLPPDNEDKEIAVRAFSEDVLNRKLLLNVEYKSTTLPAASLHDPNTNADIAKALVADGLLLVERRRERRLKELVDGYVEAQNKAKSNRQGIWEYGDITQDDAAEFGR